MRATRGLALAVLVNMMRSSVAYLPSPLLRLHSNLDVRPGLSLHRAPATQQRRFRHAVFPASQTGNVFTRLYASTPELKSKDADAADPPAATGSVGGKRGLARLEDAASIKEVKEICSKLEAGVIDEPSPVAASKAEPASQAAKSEQPKKGDEKSEEEKAAIKAEREARKAAKEAAAAEKKAKKAAEAKAKAEQEAKEAALMAEPIIYTSVDAEPERHFGNYETLKSRAETGRKFLPVATLGTEEGPKEGEEVWVRCRVAGVRAKGGSCFLVLRDVKSAFHTVQACFFKDKEDVEGSKRALKFLGDLTLESIVDVKGRVVAADVKSCSQQTVELQVLRVYAVSRAPAVLPFLLEDAARSEAEIDASQDSEKPLTYVYQEARLDNRWLDLRVPANNAIMRLQSGVCRLFREALYAEGFTEIHTPKLISGESEGGAEVFRTDYFGKSACLAQSPQLYKQMAIASDLGRVFEIGPVFRAEKSNTRRHLCEFTGLDLEMAIDDHYSEALEVIHGLFKTIFNGLEQHYAPELQAVRKQYHSEPVAFTDKPCVLHWPEAMQMLKDAGEEPEELGDLTGAIELKLGELVKEKHGTDFFMLDRYPSAVRPFYTMPCPDDERYSNSFDIFIRGQEICSGAQRVHDPELLRAQVQRMGMPLEPLEDYIKAFQHAAPPHAGAGVGLERVVFLYLGLDNVRKASMFPRDPNRCSP